jgi:photosynthetic reaction center cytochrome c subunit
MRPILFMSLQSGVLAACVVVSGCERPPVDAVQKGYRGTGMVQVDNQAASIAKRALNQAPAAIPPIAADDTTTAASAYQNVQVLGDLSTGEFTRFMVAITNWVSPQEGCTYCHSAENFADDSKYTKVVSRRMLQMTQHINSGWKTHVAQTGVTCFTCHRGQPVPANIWFNDPGPAHAKAYSGNKAGQNAPAGTVALSSLPNDPFTPYFDKTDEIRVVSMEALPAGNPQDIMQTEKSYGLMMHLSQSLGVNCTFCHNSRSFSAWDQSTPQRGIAWHGIRMVRDLNANFLTPLRDTFPGNRLGPLGDAPKLNCATCHQGVNKPLYGASMLKDYPELGVSVVAAQGVATP